MGGVNVWEFAQAVFKTRKEHSIIIFDRCCRKICDGDQLIAQLAHSLLDDDHMNLTDEVVGQSPLLALTTLLDIR